MIGIGWKEHRRNHSISIYFICLVLFAHSRLLRSSPANITSSFDQVLTNGPHLSNWTRCHSRRRRRRQCNRFHLDFLAHMLCHLVHSSNYTPYSPWGHAIQHALHTHPAINNIVIIVKWAHIYVANRQTPHHPSLYAAAFDGFVNNKYQVNVKKKNHIMIANVPTNKRWTHLEHFDYLVRKTKTMHRSRNDKWLWLYAIFREKLVLDWWAQKTILRSTEYQILRHFNCNRSIELKVSVFSIP